MYDGLDTLVQAANSLERHHARAALSRPQIAMSLNLPALVVPDGRLYVTDVETGVVRPAEWLVLTRPYDLGDHVQHRVVDVFEERALPEMIARYGQVLRETLAAVVPHTTAFERAGAEDAIARRSRGG